MAGGIGITPILAQLSTLDLGRILLYWTINIRDIGLVTDTFKRSPLLAGSTRLFLSGANEDIAEKNNMIEEVKSSGVSVANRRMMASDLQSDQGLSSTWYLCTGTALRKDLVNWLVGKKTVYEDFNY